MTIARCPQCRDEVRIPVGASPRATVACPQCDARFSLGEVLQGLPPELIVIDDPAAAMPPAISRGPAETISLAPPPAFDFEQREAPRFEVPRVTANRSAAATAARRRRAEPAGANLLSMLAVVGGGLCALPLAQLVLWWFFGQDPARMGPKVAQYVPFVVPQQFRGGLGAPPVLSAETEPESPTRPPGLPRPGRRENSSDDTPSPPRTTPSDSRTPAANDAAASPQPSDSLATPLESDRKRPASLDDLTRSTPAELDAALREALLSFDDWTSAAELPDEERRNKLDSFYDDYCTLGERLARFDPSSAEDRWIGQVDQVLRLQLHDPALATFLANRATQRLQRESSESSSAESTDDSESPESAGADSSSSVDNQPGIALSGRIYRIEPGEEFTTLVLRLGQGDGPTVRVASWLPPAKDWVEGRTIVVLGRVESPERFGWNPAEARGTPVLGGYFWLLDSNTP